MGRHRRVFQLGATLNSVVWTLCTSLFVETHFHFLRVESLGHRVWVCLTLLGPAQQFFKVVVPMYTPTNAWDVILPHILANLPTSGISFFFFQFSPSGGVLVVWHCVVCISRMTNGDQHLSIMFIAHLGIIFFYSVYSNPLLIFLLGYCLIDL